MVRSKSPSKTISLQLTKNAWWNLTGKRRTHSPYFTSHRSGRKPPSSASSLKMITRTVLTTLMTTLSAPLRTMIIKWSIAQYWEGPRLTMQTVKTQSKITSISSQMTGWNLRLCRRAYLTFLRSLVFFPRPWSASISSKRILNALGLAQINSASS